MELDSIERAKQIAEEMGKKAREGGSGATFGVYVVRGGTKNGQVFVEKEKPDGEIVLYNID